MLSHVYFPIAALETMRPAEVVALLRLMAHADLAGHCWPMQATLAAGTTMSPAAMQRAIAGLAERGDLEVTHRFARSNVYTLATRFRRADKKPGNFVRERKPVLRTFANIPRTSSGHPEDEPAPIPASGCQLPDFEVTEGEALKDQESKNLKEGPGAAAPPLRPAQARNPWARQPWLRKLSTYAGERLSGPQRMLAWELIAAAEAGELGRAQQRAIDQLDRQMRACGYR
jgi:hypothetical protein